MAARPKAPPPPPAKDEQDENENENEGEVTLSEALDHAAGWLQIAQQLAEEEG